MLKVALGGLLEDPPRRKEGKKDVKIESIRRKGSLALEEGRFKHTRKCSVLQGAIVSIERMKSLSERMKSLSERMRELEHLRRLVRDLELEVRGRRRRRDHEERGEGLANVGGRYRAGSHQSGSHRHLDHLREYADRDSISPEERRPRNAAMDVMSCALHRAARSPFSRDIERAPMLSRFTCPPFNSYDGKTDPIEHVSHYI